jgi:hypothetical protein
MKKTNLLLYQCYDEHCPLYEVYLVHMIFLKSRWEDNIKMVPKEIVWDGVDWIHLA